MRVSELNIAGAQVSNGYAPAPLQTVLERFSHYRLLTLDADPTTREPTVELAHEALIASWERLRDWIAASREGLRMHRMLTEAAQKWKRLGYDDGALYRGARLAQAQEWASSDHPANLNDLERRFMQASQHAAMDATHQKEVPPHGELEQVRALAHNQQHRINAQTHTIQRLRRRILYLSIAVGLIVVAALIAAVLGILTNTFAAEAPAILSGSAYAAISVTRPLCE